jgi:hypothetical protein
LAIVFSALQLSGAFLARNWLWLAFSFEKKRVNSSPLPRFEGVVLGCFFALGFDLASGCGGIWLKMAWKAVFDSAKFNPRRG